MNLTDMTHKNLITASETDAPYTEFDSDTDLSDIGSNAAKRIASNVPNLQYAKFALRGHISRGEYPCWISDLNTYADAMLRYITYLMTR